MRFYRIFMYKHLGPAFSLLALAALPVCAADINTFSFSSGMNCNGVWKLPDTGQALCYNASGQSACPVSGFPGQDAQYTPAAVQMSYTVLNPVGISSVTVDNVTGLMWVTNPQTDAGFKDMQTWESALTSCTVTLNGMAYGGYTDWRLPNVSELMSIMDYGKASEPYINAAAFPGAVSYYYWASTSWGLDPFNALFVPFGPGGVGYNDKTNSVYVRCVRGGP
ncbi:MAG TPA: hypothetical protein DEQ38_11700 [Elusimicrobia bacterium]|nr:hypothetical protein [Elusimicrobiota bacterium]